MYNRILEVLLSVPGFTLSDRGLPLFIFLEKDMELVVQDLILFTKMINLLLKITLNINVNLLVGLCSFSLQTILNVFANKVNLFNTLYDLYVSKVILR